MSRGAPSNEWTARQPIRSAAPAVVGEEKESEEDHRIREAFAQFKKSLGYESSDYEDGAVQDDATRAACDGLWGRHSPPQGACERCLELETQIVTLKRTAQRLSRQLVGAVTRVREEELATGMAAGVKLAQEVGRAGIELGEAKAMAREAARDDEDAAKEREGAGW